MEAPFEGSTTKFGVCLINSSNKVFAVSTFDSPDVWQMPQVMFLSTSADKRSIALKGVSDDDEDTETVALRMLKEETGIESVKFMAMIWLQVGDMYSFSLGPGGEPRFQCRSDWKSRAHKWFFFRFTGEEEEINLKGDGKENPQFGRWAWMSPEEILEHTLDSKKPLYKEAFESYFS